MLSDFYYNADTQEKAKFNPFMLLTPSIWSVLNLIQYVFNVLTSSLYPSIFICRPFCYLYSTVMVRYVMVQVLRLSTHLQHCSINVFTVLNPLNAELNPICHLLALLGVHHFLHLSRIRVKSLTLRLLM